jgi:hypothetical protein
LILIQSLRNWWSPPTALIAIAEAELLAKPAAIGRTPQQYVTERRLRIAGTWGVIARWGERLVWRGVGGLWHMGREGLPEEGEREEGGRRDERDGEGEREGPVGLGGVWLDQESTLDSQRAGQSHCFPGIRLTW